MICDLLYKFGFCLAHEYFQPYQYLPILANRWGCLKEDLLDKEKFINQLIRFRTLKSGWLGINLHGSHLPIYYNFKEYFPSSKKIFIRIRRRNVIAQAVSYEIASQTEKWSSKFKTDVTPVYSFDKIKSKIKAIKQQEIITDVFVSSLNENVIEIVYEDFITNPSEVLYSVIPEELLKKVIVEPSIKKQSSNLNKLWIDQFNQEFFKTNGKGIPAKKQKLILPIRIIKRVLPSLRKYIIR
ncbi:hypothetical protein GCM10009409_28660 [Shewanella saliphila]|uniref:Sulphotransferase Stf0 domain-containing protein n=2 Tax=Shewanella saliphila TaxID=2282698 RepID=A0ABQ2QA72_9GAMM|nr:hypothetical protein GCM10009409_28660 [Shewanella saliphila]